MPENLINAFRKYKGAELLKAHTQVWNRMLAEFYPDRKDESNKWWEDEGFGLLISTKEVLEKKLRGDSLFFDKEWIMGVPRFVVYGKQIKDMGLNVSHELLDLVP